MNFVEITQGVVVVLISSAVIGIVGIYRQLLRLNGRVAASEQWHQEHDRQDVERFESARLYTDARFTALQREFDMIREQMRRQPYLGD